MLPIFIASMNAANELEGRRGAQEVDKVISDYYGRV